MRERWFGDNRDLVKWGSLIQLAEEGRISTVVQVLYLTESPRPELEREGAAFVLSDRVWKHFRNIRSVESLAGRFPGEIRVFDRPFIHADRSGYHDELVTELKTLRRRKKIVFLDPDTGIAPSRATERHVTLEEIKRIWSSLGSRDWLVLYQHRPHKKNWVTESAERFRETCEGAPVDVFRGPYIASDVVFLAAQKNS